VCSALLYRGLVLQRSIAVGAVAKLAVPVPVAKAMAEAAQPAEAEEQTC
jgi:hypothetical protein